MIETEAQLRGWGRSLGVVIPKDQIIKEKLKQGDLIKIVFLRKNKTNPLKETFGIFKFKKPIKEILNEGDRESWDE